MSTFPMVPFVLLLSYRMIDSTWSLSINTISPAIGRRQAFAAGLTFFGGITTTTPERASAATTISDDEDVSSLRLLSLIPTMDCDAPATNVTVSRALSMEIEQLATALETKSDDVYTKDNAISSQLSGSWRLIYSNAAEITSLAAKLPLGFCLGPTYQPLDTTQGFFENNAPIQHPWHLGQLQVSVVGDVTVASAGTVNAVGVVNDRNNRVNVEFRAITFQLQELLGFPAQFQKSLIPNDDKSRAPPANDVTYLDKNLRIVRGGDGALFVFVRDNVSRMLTKSERDILFSSSSSEGKDVDVGVGVAESSDSPELRFLFESRK